MTACGPKQTFRELSGGRDILEKQCSVYCTLQTYYSGKSLLGAGMWLFASPAYAEVSDKILSVPGMWVQAILIGSVAILAGSYKWWLGLPFMILPIVIALSTFGLRHGSELGPAILQEHGESYFFNFYASALLAALMVGLGIWMGWRR